jgi:hypothetical protein
MFFEFGIESIWGRVLKTNKRALRYNRALGYVFDPPDPASDVVIGRLTRASYERASIELRRILGLDEG